MFELVQNFTPSKDEFIEIFKILITLSNTDHVFSAEEKELVHNFSQTCYPEEDLTIFYQENSLPVNYDLIQHQEELMALLFMLAYCDGSLSEKEMDYILDIGFELEIPPEKVKIIHDKVCKYIVDNVG
jgi:hypothetical protein